jgi:hypothetical protein
MVISGLSHTAFDLRFAVTVARPHARIASPPEVRLRRSPALPVGIGYPRGFIE